jgi:hypothetical protein
MASVPVAVDTSVFGVVLFVVVIVAAVIGVIAVVGNRGLYDQIGKGGLYQEDLAVGGSTESAADRDAEIRQMLQARSERLERQGKAGLDIDAELARLQGSVAPDPGLVAEVRQLVIARNERRERQGKAPLDVEAEVERQLREFGA